MDAFLEQARDLFEGTIDFKGQALTDFLTTALLTITGIAAFFSGYLTQNIYNSLYVGGAGTVVTLLLVVPPWPHYNSQPLIWLPSKTGKPGIQGIQIVVDGKKIS